jgi:uncharacterized protein
MTEGGTFRSRELTPEEIRDLLRRVRWGRMVYVDGPRVEVRPVGYVFEEGWIFGRFEEGGKLDALRHIPWVAFQVDEIEGYWNWQSVLVHGGVHFLDEGQGEAVDEVRNQAIAALTRGMPDFGRPGDPGAHRVKLFGIAIHELSGRMGRLESGH